MSLKATNRIKLVLVEQNKTSRWLAEQLFMNASTISRWCTNEAQPSLKSLFRVADLLNIDPQDLIATKAKSKTDDK